MKNTKLTMQVLITIFYVNIIMNDSVYGYTKISNTNLK